MTRLERLIAAASLAIIAIAGGGCANHARTEQAVIVHFDYGSRDWAPFFQFEDSLERAINASGSGDYDGNELAVDGSDGELYMYGPNADKLFAVAKPLLQSTGLLKNIVVTLRYGAADDNTAREIKVRVDS